MQKSLARAQISRRDAAPAHVVRELERFHAGDDVIESGSGLSAAIGTLRSLPHCESSECFCLLGCGKLFCGVGKEGE